MITNFSLLGMPLNRNQLFKFRNNCKTIDIANALSEESNMSEGRVIATEIMRAKERVIKYNIDHKN